MTEKGTIKQTLLGGLTVGLLYYLYYVDVEIRKVSRKTRTSGHRAQRRKK